MKRETAERMLEILQSIEEEAKPLAEMIEQIECETEKKKFRRAWAHLIGILFVDFTLPISKQFPELDVKP
jgi:hypothetical protein